MLKSLDTIISLTAVMLVASMAVTVLTEVYTALRNTRGVHLREGLIDLLRQIDPNFRDHIMREIAGKILSHPLIRDSSGRLGALVHRDEFTRLLLELAAGSGPQAISTEAKLALTRTLAANGIADPEAALKTIRDLALEFEESHPTIAAHVRRDLAILQGAKSDLVARINSSFDQTIDRISSRFTLTTRQVSFAASFIVALVLQLDSIALIRNVISPGTLQPAHFPGMVLSTLLLSLGAPFWFETLKNLLRLRSSIATKDDEQRTNRAKSGAPLLPH
jgi:hypothetical protein